MAKKVEIGDVVEARIFRITAFGAFVRLSGNQRGLIHISQVSDDYVKNINDHLKVGDKVKARVVSIKEGKIDLTLKSETPNRPNSPSPNQSFRFSLLGEKLGEFLEKSKKKQKPKVRPRP